MLITSNLSSHFPSPAFNLSYVNTTKSNDWAEQTLNKIKNSQRLRLKTRLVDGDMMELLISFVF